jgi:hypothetical protein
MIARITDVEKAPDIPCTKRAAIKRPWLSLKPHTAEAAVKVCQSPEEDLLAPDQVTEPAGHQEESGEGNQVGVDHPGQPRLREVQVMLNLGQRDVDDGRVEGVHQHREADDDQREPAAAVRVC